MSAASFHHPGIPSDCITPLVITESGLEEYPGLSSGTGFFASSGREVFMFTALHCLESANPPVSHVSTVKKLTIPFRLGGHTKSHHDYVDFDYVTRLAEDPSAKSFVDVIALHVKPGLEENHAHLLSRAARLPPSGLWLNRFADLEEVQEAMDGGEPITFVVIGYPNHGTTTAISYYDSIASPPIINVQPAQFTANLRRSSLDHCMLLQGSTWPRGHAGFSGSPVFVQWHSSDKKLAALAGLVICGSSNQLHFIDVATLVRATERAAPR